MNKKSKEEKRSKAYSLRDFLNDCKNHRDRIYISEDAQLDAIKSPANLYGKTEILDFIVQHKEDDFKYVNTKPFKKGKMQLIDGYNIYLKGWVLYVAFFKTVQPGWYIKSFHPDDNFEVASIMDLINNKKVIGKR